MSNKKKKVITVEAGEEIRIETTQPEHEPKTVSEKVGDFVTTLTSCGHVNKQSYNENNELEDLFCTLDKGHKGDHSATLNEKKVYWADAAGIPVRKHA